MRKIEPDGFFNIGFLLHNPLYETVQFVPSQREGRSTPQTGPNPEPQKSFKVNDYSSHKESVEEINNPSKWGEHYCVECQKTRVFKVSDKIIHTANYVKSNAGLKVFTPGIIVHEYECSANQIHRMYYVYKVISDTIMKIGQYPSISDLKPPPNKEFKNILGDEKLKEYNKAINLYKLGNGIGSFVYLRRILEHQIENAHLDALENEANWNEEVYNKSRMKDKIKLLSHFLPEFLIENRNIYSILSLGVHELEEDECLRYFNVMKSSIDVIVNEKISKSKKEKQKIELMKEINKINQYLSKK